MADGDEKEYITLDTVAKEIGMKKSSLYYYINALGIETHKFPLNKHAFIGREDMQRIQDAKNSPWKLLEIKEQGNQ